MSKRDRGEAEGNKEDAEEKHPIATYQPSFSIFNLVRDGDVGAMTRALQLDPNRVRSHDDMGKTALHFAASLGKVTICQVLIDYGADVDARTHNMSTPLHTICAAQPPIPLDDSKAIIRMLFDKEANFSLSTPEDESALNIALNAQNEALATFLLRLMTEDAIYYRDETGETCAHIAAQFNYIAFLKEIARSAPKVFLVVSNRGTPLHVALDLVYTEAANIIMDSILDRFGEEELRIQLNQRRDCDDLSPTAIAFMKQSLDLARKCIKYGGNIDKPFNSVRWSRPCYCYEGCFARKNLELLTLVLDYFGDESLPGQYDTDSNAWVLCLEYGAQECLLALDKRQKRPRNGFESVDWNYHRYTSPWALNRRRIFSDLTLQGVSLLQKFMRENIPRTPLALTPIRYPYPNFPEMLEAVLQGESIETIKTQLREEFLFSGPFLDWDVVKRSFAKRLDEWPFNEETEFEKYSISLFEHMANAEANAVGSARDMMKYGLQLEIRKCPCGACDDRTTEYAQPHPDHPEISLALNAADYFLRIPMCRRMRHLFKIQKQIEDLSSVATLQAHARYALRRMRKVRELVDDEWIDRLPLPRKLQAFLAHSIDVEVFRAT